MAAQLSYNYGTPRGIPGGIADLTCYTIDSMLNEEKPGVMRFGVGVMQGTDVGHQVKLPNGCTAEKFEGVTVNNLTTEYDIEGKIHIRNGAAIGVMRAGRIHARLAKDAKPAYGAKAYVVTTAGDDLGCFTEKSEGTLEVGVFLSGADNGTAILDLNGTMTGTDAGE